MGTAAIKLIHVAKRELRMDDDDYRDLLFRTAGQSSAKDLSDDGAQAVIEEMKRLGFRPKTQRNGALTGPFAPKLVALWLSAWRSEEHTSELQSLMRISYAGLCLKKKKRHYTR